MTHSLSIPDISVSSHKHSHTPCSHKIENLLLSVESRPSAAVSASTKGHKWCKTPLQNRCSILEETSSYRKLSCEIKLGCALVPGGDDSGAPVIPPRGLTVPHKGQAVLRRPSLAVTV